MPASERSLQLTDAYRAQLLELRQRVALATSRGWQQVTVDRLEQSFAGWLQTSAVATVTAAQRVGVTLAGAYVTAYVASELGRHDASPAATSDGSELIGRGRDGRPLAQVLTPALITVRIGLRDGRGPRRALQMGFRRASLAISNEVIAAPRAAQDLAMAREPRVIGWRRATRAGACLACYAAATGAIQHESTALRVHGHCTCFKEAVVGGVRERVHRPTGQQLFDAMSASDQDARYGAKAELIRSGQVPLAALEHRQPMADVPDEITEAPLSALHPAPA